MKKDIIALLYKCLLAAVPLLLLMSYLYLFPMNYMDDEYPMWMQQLDAVNTPHDRQEIIFLGDSRTKAAIIPALLSDESYQLSLGGATPLEMYATMEKYLRQHAKPKMVCISFAPCHFEKGQTAFWLRTMYFHYLDLSDAWTAIDWSTELNDSNFMRKNPYMELLLYQLRSPSIYITPLINSKMFGRLEFNQQTYERLEQQRGHTLFGRREGSSDLNTEAKRAKFVLSPVMDRYYRLLIKLCLDQGIPVVIEQLPMNQSSYDALTPEYKEAYETYMQDIFEDYPALEGKREVIWYDDSLFGDYSHLNQAGAELYTTYIRQEYAAYFS